MENARVDPCDVSISPEYSSGIRTNLVTSSELEQPLKIQRMCMDFLIMSPPTPMFQMRSPRMIYGDAADNLSEQENGLGYGSDL